jgi:pimeloyl-ACP methyl ester carboxylesterase
MKAWAGNRALVPIGTEERFANVAGHRMRYLVGGSGPALLFVHGLMGYSFSFSEILPNLVRDFTVYAPDMLNLGFSDRADIAADLRATAERMIAFMDAVGLEKAIVIGSSQGGTIALQMGVIAPERLDRLVLVSPAHPWSERSRWQIRLFATPLGAVLARVMPLAPALWMAFGLRRLYNPSSRILPGTVSGYSAPMGDGRTLAFLLRVARCWNADFERLERSIVNMDLPVHLIWGACDRIVPLSTAKNLGKHLRNATIDVMSDCGHLPYEERPEEFVQVLRQLLQREGQGYA